MSALQFLKHLEMMQVTKVLTKTKTSKGNSTPAVNCAGVNYGKPKLTNPKPFRLRTDVNMQNYFGRPNLEDWKFSVVSDNISASCRRDKFLRRQTWRRNCIILNL